MPMSFKVAYTSDKNNISGALQAGKIDNGDMVLVTDAASNYGELVIVDANGNQVEISGSVRKFDNLQLANAWLADKTNPPVGEMVSILVDGKYVLYTINESDGSYILETSAGGENMSWITF